MGRLRGALTATTHTARLWGRERNGRAVTSVAPPAAVMYCVTAKMASGSRAGGRASRKRAAECSRWVVAPDREAALVAPFRRTMNTRRSQRQLFTFHVRLWPREAGHRRRCHITREPARYSGVTLREPPAAAPTLGTPASELHPAMALNAATDQQYHLLDQDGTADDQMDQLQGDHDTLMQQHILQQTEAQMKQFFVEFQDLKRYVHESLDKETKRRRKQSQPRSQESDAKSMLTSDAESTPTSSHHGN
ncbi:hypothetical protein MRX96_001096 [Rhipicephalus microplus]